MTRAVFLDRDGVLNEEVYSERMGRWDAPFVPEDLALTRGVSTALRALSDLGYELFIVSNQAAYAKGSASLRSLWRVHERLVGLLAADGIQLKDSFYAYGHPDGVVPAFTGCCLERKPSPYFLLIAEARYELDMACSWMIGDQDIDVACGQAAGVRTILVANEHAGDRASHSQPDFRVADLAAAAAIIRRCG
jgi:D-glycero-D-manno-heptose 1,7-bisphosphate phosphatase